jgi:hypothetical protein
MDRVAPNRIAEQLFYFTIAGFKPLVNVKINIYGKCDGLRRS